MTNEKSSTPSEVHACLDLLQETIDQIQNDSQQEDPLADSTDGKTSTRFSSLEGYLNKYENWSDWRFLVYIKTMGDFKKMDNQKWTTSKGSVKVKVDINILQAAIMMKDIKMVEMIIELANKFIVKLKFIM